MVIRPIRREELDAFAAVAARPEPDPEFRDYLTRTWESGAVRPEWCFVAEDPAGRVVGRISYWTFVPGEPPETVDFLQFASDADHRALGAALLRETLPQVDLGDRTELEYVLDDPPRFPTDAARVVEALEGYGFRLARQTDRWEWTPERPVPTVPDRLTFRTFDEVGRDAFRDAVARVSTGSLDRRIRESVEEHGTEGDAREHMEFLEAMPHDPAWWRLAYEPDGALVGLVAPARTQTHPVIGYIGVEPERRGRGYVHDLLAEGTAQLAAAGAERIRADTDVENAPMAAAFRRAGYARFASRREYFLTLPLG